MQVCQLICSESENIIVNGIPMIIVLTMTHTTLHFIMQIGSQTPLAITKDTSLFGELTANII